MKKTRKRKRCRHDWGPVESHPKDGDPPYRVCLKCRQTRFEGDRYCYGSRWRW